MTGPSSSRKTFEPVSSTSFLAVRLQLARLGVADSGRLDRILEHATRLSGEQLAVARVGIWLFDDERTSLSLLMLYDSAHKTHVRPETRFLASEIAPYVEAILERRALIVQDARSHAATRVLTASYLEPNGIASLLDAPIFRRGQVAGVVCHEHIGSPRAWSAREVDFAATVADMVALYFEQAEAAHAEQLLLAQEKEVMRAERLASVGVLARYVAHDLNNAVAPILMCATQLKTALVKDAKSSERVQIILDAAEHGASLARKLLAAAAGESLAREPVLIDSLLLESQPLLSAIAGEGIEIVLEQAASGISVPADPVALIRAVVNLVSNARDALGGTGRVIVRTDADARAVMLSVVDEGSGMSEHEKAHLFQPFYTTKPGRGTGLGLASIRHMVEALNGQIQVASAAGQGTTVTLTLPIAQPHDGSR